MNTGIIRMIGLGVLLMTGAVQAAVVGLNTFANEYVGANVTVTLSQAATNGFKINYNTIASGDSFVITSAGLSSGARTLAAGESAVLTFTYASGKLSTMNLGFRWGFDFGATTVLLRADTASSGGAYSSVFLRESFSTSGDPMSSGSNVNDISTPLPPVTEHFKGGNSDATVVTTLKRVSGDDYTLSVNWGGETYNHSYTFSTSDDSIDTIFFGHGQGSGGGVAVGDNYTISDVSLNVIPEPATISMLGIGAVVVMLIRRTQCA